MALGTLSRSWNQEGKFRCMWTLSTFIVDPREGQGHRHCCWMPLSYSARWESPPRLVVSAPVSPCLDQPQRLPEKAHPSGHLAGRACLPASCLVLGPQAAPDTLPADSSPFERCIEANFMFIRP